MGSTKNSNEHTANAQQMVVTHAECLLHTWHCAENKAKHHSWRRGTITAFFKYRNSGSCILFSSQASNHPSLSWDAALACTSAKSSGQLALGWETGPTYHMNILLIWGWMQPSLEGLGLRHVLNIMPQSEITAFSTQHKLDGLVLCLPSQLPDQGYFHACWSGASLSFPRHKQPATVTQMPARGRAL